jgi:hypothetical protein
VDSSQDLSELINNERCSKGIFRKKIEREGRNWSVRMHDVHIQEMPGVDDDSLN